MSGPEHVVFDGEKCERFDSFIDSYCFGSVRFHVCLYRCPDRVIHVRSELQLCGVAVGVKDYTVDSDGPPPIGGRCPKQVRDGETTCELTDEYELVYLGGLYRVHVCAYACADGKYSLGEWEVSIFGRPQGKRRKAHFPWPI